jgi:hypothetical protein
MSGTSDTNLNTNLKNLITNYDKQIANEIEKKKNHKKPFTNKHAKFETDDIYLETKKITGELRTLPFSYPEWFRFMAASGSCFSFEKARELSIFLSSGTNYKEGDEGKVDQILQSLKENSNCLSPEDKPGIGTIIHIAREKGICVKGLMNSLNTSPESQCWVEQEGSLVTYSIDFLVDYMNERFAFIKDCFAAPYYDFKAELFRKKGHMEELLSTYKFFNGKNFVSAFKIWYSHSQRRNYKTITFKEKGDETINEYNTYKPKRYLDVPGNIDLILDFIKSCICNNNEEVYSFLICYLAHLIQKPFEKIPLILILKGPPGTGKNTFCEDIIGQMLGKYYLKLESLIQLVSNFNIHLFGKILISIDEADWGKDHKILSTIKSLSGSHMAMYEQKNGPKLSLPNPSRYILTTNSSIPIGLDIGDRRFCFIENSPKYANDHAYFKNLKKNLKANDGIMIDHLMYYLSEYDISKFNPYKPVQTEYDKRESIISSHGSVADFWNEIIFYSPKKIFESNKGLCASEAYSEYERFIDFSRRWRIKEGHTSFWSKTQDLIPNMPDATKRITSNGARIRVKEIFPDQIVKSLSITFDIKEPEDFRGQDFYISHLSSLETSEQELPVQPGSPSKRHSLQ